MESQKIKKDILMWGIFLVLGVLMIAVIIPGQIPVSTMLSKEYITPRTFPTTLCAALIIVSLLGVITSCLKYARARRESPQQAAERAHLTKEEIREKIFPYLMFALILLYSLLFQKIGFVWATVIVPPVILYLLNCRKWYMYLALYAFAATVYVIFTLVLHVPLP